MGKGEYSMIEKDYAVTIIRTMNGFIIRHYEEIEPNRYRKVETVVEEKDSVEGNDCEAIQHMLYEVLDYFGLSGSKHDKERVRIEIEKQGDD